MFVWQDPKGPAEIKDYDFNWTKDLGADTIASASAEFVDERTADLVIEDDSGFSGVTSKVWVSGGTAEQTALIRGTITTTGGRTFTEVGVLLVGEEADPASASLLQLQADLIVLKDARLAMLTGTSVKEVWRDGRRMVYNVASVGDLDRAIAAYEGYITAAEDAVSPPTKRRMRALSVRF